MKNALTTNGSPDFSTPRAVVRLADAGGDLRSLALQSLADHPNFRALLMRQAICVQSEDDKLVVNGNVPSFYHNQLLQETLRRVAGIVHVENRVTVVYPSGLPQD